MLIDLCYRTDGVWGGGEQYTIAKWTHPCAPGVPHPVLGSPCPPPGKDVSQCQRLVKRKGVIYLKSYTNLSNVFTEIPKSFRIPTNSQSFLPPLPSPGYRISEKEIEVRGSSLPRPHGPKKTRMAATPGFKSQSQSSSATPFPTHSTIGHSCWHSHILPALLGCHSKSG